MFKKIFIAVVIFFIIYLLLCVIGEKRMEATSTKTISGNPQQVFYQIAEFKNWPKWSPWMRQDSTIKITYGQTTTGVGGSYSWESKESGAGSMTFTEIIKDQKTRADLKFEGFDIVSDVTMELKSNGDKTDVIWTLIGKTETPFMQRGITKIMSYFYNIKNDFDKGLNFLEEVVANGGAGFNINEYIIQEGSYNGGHFLTSTRKKVSLNEVSSFFEYQLPLLAQTAGGNMKGVPTGIYWDLSKDSKVYDLVAAVPVIDKNIKYENFNIMTIEGTKELFTDYYGAYQKTYLAYSSLDSSCKAHGREKPDLVIEEYITDPMVEKDTAKWLTRIHYLLMEKK